MSRYFMHYDGRGKWIEMPSSATSEQYGEVQRAFAGNRSSGGLREYAQMTRLSEHDKAEGLYYSWELAGPDGASYWLFQMPGDTNEKVAAAKRYLYRQHDVVRLKVIRITTLEPEEAPKLVESYTKAGDNFTEPKCTGDLHDWKLAEGGIAFCGRCGYKPKGQLRY